jgi:seryl-tRNA synthetase
MTSKIVYTDKLNVNLTASFVQDLKELRTEVSKSIGELEYLSPQARMQRRGLQPTALLRPLKHFEDDLNELSARVNTVKKELPKVLAALQAASE